MKLSTCAKLILGLVLLASLAAAGPVVFTRPLGDAANLSAPIQNLYTLGDDFVLSANATIDSLSVWVVSGTPRSVSSTSPSPLNEYNMGLYLAADNLWGTPVYLQSATTSATFVDWLNGAGNEQYGIWKVTFSGLNYAATAGTYYDFAVQGTSKGAYATSFALLATAFDSDPAAATDYDNQILAYAGSPFGLATAYGPPDYPARDINVEVTELGGAAVPEPATFGLMGVALAGLAWKLRRK